MAVIARLPHKDIISGFKGTIDFYVWRPSRAEGTSSKLIPCARRWPRSPGHRRAPAVEAQWDAFSYAAKLWPYLDAEVQDAWIATATESGQSGRDYQVKGLITSYFRDGQWD